MQRKVKLGTISIPLNPRGGIRVLFRSKRKQLSRREFGKLKKLFEVN